MCDDLPKHRIRCATRWRSPNRSSQREELRLWEEDERLTKPQVALDRGCVTRCLLQRGSCLLAAYIVTFSSPEAGSAQENDPAVEAARVAFDRAMVAFEHEVYTDAEDGFRRAHELMPLTRTRRPLILQNIAVSIERQGGRDADALDAWLAYRKRSQG